MAGFCANCGAPLPDGADVCGQCGTPVNKSNGGAATSQTSGANIASKSGNKNRFIGMAVVGVAVLIVVILVAKLVIGNTGYKSALDKCFKALAEEDVDKFFDSVDYDIFTDWYAKELEDYYGEGWEDEWEWEDSLEDSEEYVERGIDKIEDEVGSKFKITYEIRDEDKLTKKEIRDINDLLEDGYDSDKEVTEGYKLKLRVKYKGSDDEHSETYDDIYVLKIDGEWKVDIFAMNDNPFEF